MSQHLNYRSGNPALSSAIFSAEAYKANASRPVMTLNGAVDKTILCLSLLLSCGIAGFKFHESLQGFLIPGVIAGLIVGLITVFKKEYAPITAPIYACVEGIVLGIVSASFEQLFDGIVFQAIGLTSGIFFSLLFLYKSRLIKPTENFKLGIAAATGGIFLLYAVNFIMSFFGAGIPVLNPMNSSMLSIGISLVIVVIASLNLVVDFDFIEEGAEQGVPKYMEWYAAFGLMVTLIWLYLEILKLLAKLRSR
ncbi:MAG: Bax inhibitor-1/YccA family membrane protein [Coraliomargaritaceae bacterium]